MKIAVVTATTNPERAKACIESWGDWDAVPRLIILNGQGTVLDSLDAEWLVPSCTHYFGTVPAFKMGVEAALTGDADIIACLHDDLRIDDPEWAARVLRHFAHHPACGLLGFGGAIGLGADQIYQTPYDPMQLARIGFRSNLDDAEVHGTRSLLAERVACLDGFSQVGRREFWEGHCGPRDVPVKEREKPPQLPWTILTDAGIVHHAYDSMLGAIAQQHGWETWYLPIRCHHYGGQTAVGDQGYARWATATHGGDHALWEQAHRAFYEYGRGILPIRL